MSMPEVPGGDRAEDDAIRDPREPGLPDRRGVLLSVAYDGTHFSGWAPQAPQGGVRTVADVLRGAIVAIDPRASAPRGTSRTDAGVHAEGQLVAFDATLPLPPRGWVLALNTHLPDDVAVRSARPVPVGYNPRFASRAKRYRYRLLLERVRHPLHRFDAWRIGWALDLRVMQEEARLLEGTHDFAAFRAAADERPSTVRTLHRVSVELDEASRSLQFVFEGNAFLYNMVRILVGTLVDVGRGNLPPGTIARALAGGDRRLAGMTAPAHGLTLQSIDVELPDGAGEPWPG